MELGIGDVELFLTTLWSPVPPDKVWGVEMGMADCQRIIYNGKKFGAAQYINIHSQCLSYLQKALSESKSEKKIVVTHHVPTERCNPEKYKTSPLNTAFVVELHDFIFDSKVDCWLYGHSHANMPEIDLNGTRMLCNQLGYVHHGEHTSFRQDASFEL